MDRNALSIIEVTDAILEQMETSGFKESTRGFYMTLFRRLCRMAERRRRLPSVNIWVKSVALGSFSQ